MTRNRIKLIDSPREIEIKVADHWLKSGAIRVDTYGEENTYYVDDFNYKFYCKNYPNYGPRP